MKVFIKILGILIAIIIVIALLLGIYAWYKNQERDKAHKHADHIIQNLNKDEIYQEFPEKYFKKEQLRSTLGELTSNCDWDNRDGKYVDFFSMRNVGANDNLSFIYEYYLDCDSLRFILTYEMAEEPTLKKINIEPIEVKNPLILYPEKQLKNRGSVSK